MYSHLKKDKLIEKETRVAEINSSSSTALNLILRFNFFRLFPAYFIFVLRTYVNRSCKITF